MNVTDFVGQSIKIWANEGGKSGCLTGLMQAKRIVVQANFIKWYGFEADFVSG
jgi:hypothetical protein